MLSTKKVTIVVRRCQTCKRLQVKVGESKWSAVVNGSLEMLQSKFDVAVVDFTCRDCSAEAVITTAARLVH